MRHVCCLLSVGLCSLFGVRCSLFVVQGLLCVVCCALRGVVCVLFVDC